MKIWVLRLHSVNNFGIEIEEVVQEVVEEVLEAPQFLMAEKVSPCSIS